MPLAVALETGQLPIPDAPGLRVYPNPSSGVLTIEAEADEATILDVRGREVARVALNGGRGAVSTEGLPAGVYLVRAGAETVRVTVR